jgi:rhamnose transport system ATP-binding protein
MSVGIREKGSQPHRTTRVSNGDLNIVGVSKRFGGVAALQDVSLRILAGQVHALVGENGAGKSTLGKIVSGVLQPDQGYLELGDQPLSARSPREALAHGIVTIAQELAIVPGLSVAENVYLGAESNLAGFVRRAEVRRQFKKLSAGVGFDLPADRLAGSLRVADQQKVEILRAISRNASIIIMDEPTAALSSTEAKALHQVIRSMANNGQTVVLISHFLTEVLELADTITTLRDGRLVQTVRASDATEISLIEGMLGRTFGAAFPEKTFPAEDSPVVLSVEHLNAPQVHDVSFAVRAGEITGLAGLVGSGRSELARAVFGDVKMHSGTVMLNGTSLRTRGPRGALRRGLAMIPESRKDQGLLLGRSIQENVTLSNLKQVSRFGWVLPFREKREVAEVLERVVVKHSSIKSPIVSLSGGNQQKVLFARTVFCSPNVLIVDEPTRGVDVGAKRALYDLLKEFGVAGPAVLVISSELDEVLGLSHRVLVMRSGHLVAELKGSQMTQQAVLEAAFADPIKTVRDVP